MFLKFVIDLKDRDEQLSVDMQVYLASKGSTDNEGAKHRNLTDNNVDTTNGIEYQKAF